MQYLVQPTAPHTSFSPIYNGQGDRVFAISSADSGLPLTQVKARGPITQERWTESPNQQWKFISNGDGSVRIHNVGTGEVMDLDVGSQANGASVGGWPWHGGDNQRWILTEASHGHLLIKSKASNKMLDLPAGEVTTRSPGQKMQQWAAAGGLNQLWILSWLRPGYHASDADYTITAYDQANFQGRAQQFTVGKWNRRHLTRKIGDDTIRSVRVPIGMRVTFFVDDDFTGTGYSITHDVKDFGGVGGKASSLIVDKVVTLYEDPNYTGKSVALSVGIFPDPDKMKFANDKLSSLRVPRGLTATAYMHGNFTGDYRTYMDDTPSLGDFNDKVTSVIVRALGVVIPEDSVAFGDVIHLKSTHGRWFSALPREQDFRVVANEEVTQHWESFTVLRAGPSTDRTQLCFGDIVALRTIHGRLLSATSSGDVTGRVSTLGAYEQWQLVRAGASSHTTFVCGGDHIALRNLGNNLHLMVEPSGTMKASQPWIKEWETFGLKHLPRSVVCFKTPVALGTHHRRWVSVNPDGSLHNQAQSPGDSEHFTLVRASAYYDPDMIRFHTGDVDLVALRASNGMYVSQIGGRGVANATTIGDAQKFKLLRGPSTLHSDFLCADDTVYLEAISNRRLMSAESNGGFNINTDKQNSYERFRVQPRPAETLTFGQKISLLGVHGKYVVATSAGALNASSASEGAAEQFELLRATDLNHRGAAVRWGEPIALRAAHGQYVMAHSDGNAYASVPHVQTWETFELLPVGTPKHEFYVTAGDRVALHNQFHNKYLTAEPNGTANANRDNLGLFESFRLGRVGQPATTQLALQTDAIVAFRQTGSVACPAAQPGQASCGYNLQSKAGCSIAVCGEAAGQALTLADVWAQPQADNPLNRCGAEADCPNDACGIDFCGADACGAAACGAAACGLAAAISGACGTDANFVEVRVANACMAKVTLVDLGLANACGANVCALELCPIDACAADACALDIIPLIPGI